MPEAQQEMNRRSSKGFLADGLDANEFFKLTMFIMCLMLTTVVCIFPFIFSGENAISYYGSLTTLTGIAYGAFAAKESISYGVSSWSNAKYNYTPNTMNGGRY